MSPLFENEPYLNKSLNSYRHHPLQRLNKQQGKPETF